MEYYDSVSNSLLYSHYSQRNVNMLTNPDVTNVLDNADKSKQVGSKIDIFKQNDNPYQTISKMDVEMAKRFVFKQNTLFKHHERGSELQDHETYDMMHLEINNKENVPYVNKNKTTIPRSSAISSVDRAQKKYFNETIKNEIKNEMQVLESKLDKIENIVSHDINSQINSFEEKRKMKKEQMKLKKRKSLKYQVRKGSKLDEILIAIGK
jgi:hypothetical protein